MYPPENLEEQESPPHSLKLLLGDLSDLLLQQERASRYSIHIDQHRSYCGTIENDFHLFFQCQLSKSVWATANTPFIVDNVNPENDGIQITLPTLLSTNPTDDLLCKSIFILRYIWKARNDNRFQRKNWTS